MSKCEREIIVCSVEHEGKYICCSECCLSQGGACNVEGETEFESGYAGESCPGILGKRVIFKLVQVKVEDND